MDRIVKIKIRREGFIWMEWGICDGMESLVMDEAFERFNLDALLVCVLICLVWIGMVGSCGGVVSWHEMIFWSWHGRGSLHGVKGMASWYGKGSFDEMEVKRIPCSWGDMEEIHKPWDGGGLWSGKRKISWPWDGRGSLEIILWSLLRWGSFDAIFPLHVIMYSKIAFFYWRDSLYSIYGVIVRNNNIIGSFGIVIFIWRFPFSMIRDRILEYFEIIISWRCILYASITLIYKILEKIFQFEAIRSLMSFNPMVLTIHFICTMEV